MRRSSERILTTHAGALPRPVGLDTAEGLRTSVAEVVRQQTEIGLDIVDGGQEGDARGLQG